MSKHTWWTEPGMTSPDAVRDAAAAAGVLLGTVDDTMDGLEVLVVIVEAHDVPWLIYPHPLSILGWVAEQVEIEDETRDVFEIEGALGWLGSGDLAADHIVANLLNADQHQESTVSTHRAVS